MRSALGAVAARLSELSETSLATGIVHAGDPLADAHDRLSPDRYAEFLAEGNAMSIEEALAYAALTS